MLKKYGLKYYTYMKKLENGATKEEALSLVTVLKKKKNVVQ